MEVLLDESGKAEPAGCFLGVQGGRQQLFPLSALPSMVEEEFERAKDPWWRSVEPVVRLLGQPGPTADA